MHLRDADEKDKQEGRIRLPFQSVNRGLDLLGTPSLIGLAHIGRWLDGGHEFQRSVYNARESDDGARYVSCPVKREQERADEDVDYGLLAKFWSAQQWK